MGMISLTMPIQSRPHQTNVNDHAYIYDIPSKKEKEKEKNSPKIGLALHTFHMIMENQSLEGIVLSQRKH